MSLVNTVCRQVILLVVLCVTMTACVAGSSSMTLLTTVCGPMDTGVCLLGRHDTAQWICGINGRQSHP